ncbi:hypothetical protein ACG7TL_006230 [Trametes sanguinea]
MDGNNQPSHGFLSHILDPQLGQVFNNLVRSVLPSHDQHQQPAEAASLASSQSNPTAEAAPQGLAVPAQAEDANSPVSADILRTFRPVSHDCAFTDVQSPSHPAPEVNAFRDNSTPSPHASSGSATPQVRDVEMDASVEHSRESAQVDSPRPQPIPRNSRRARVEDDEDEDFLRESNRQRLHSPTPHDDQHHAFMPIPEEHRVPQAGERPRSPPQADAGVHPSPSQDGTHPPHGQMMWTFDFGPAPAHRADAQTAQGPAQPGHDHHHHHDRLPTFNLFINIPVAGPGAPAQPGAANVNGNAAPIYIFNPYFYPTFTDGGNNAGQPAFVFPPFTFPFGQFGMDLVEERDDPERAQRLVDGLEEVPIGLVKRMERAGGPGTGQGETPTCAVCWESLLEPEGGGFEGNAELARAEAAEAAREDAASRQGSNSSMDVDGPASAASDASSSSPGASSSTTTSTTPGGERHPKVVVLPCSHVFHASCLLPWFSKPGRTTCPSCRFDIDPDSLTYRPRPLRSRRPEPQPAPQPAAAAQPQQPPAYGPAPPPFAPAPLQFAPAPAQAAPSTPQTAQTSQLEAHPAQGDAGAQPRQQHPPLPPFITFDINMIIPIFPGRPAGAAQPTAPGAQPSDATAQANPQANAQDAPSQARRTDRNGFRLDDPFLAEAVRTTFERIFGRPAPPPQAQAQPQPQPQQPAAGQAPPGDVPLDWFTFAGPLPGFPPVPPPSTRRGAPERPVPKRKWTLPPPPGPTLRQLVERNEREMGLRCSDVSCGLGPSDDDPTTTFDATALRQISIRPLKSGASSTEAVCEHKFHPSCLVSAERVAGWGGEDKKEDREDAGEDVEVSCPVCRAVGVISRLDWEEGACALA